MQIRIDGETLQEAIVRREDGGPTVLLIGQDPLIALEMGEALTEAGYRIARPLKNHAEASDWMAWRRPDLAVIDLPLQDGDGDGDGAALARALRAEGVPFLVHADGPRDAAACAELRVAPRLSRPARHRDLVHVLGQLSREARP